MRQWPYPIMWSVKICSPWQVSRRVAVQQQCNYLVSHNFFSISNNSSKNSFKRSATNNTKTILPQPLLNNLFFPIYYSIIFCHHLTNFSYCACVPRVCSLGCEDLKVLLRLNEEFHCNKNRMKINQFCNALWPRTLLVQHPIPTQVCTNCLCRNKINLVGLFCGARTFVQNAFPTNYLLCNLRIFRIDYLYDW